MGDMAGLNSDCKRWWALNFSNLVDACQRRSYVVGGGLKHRNYFLTVKDIELCRCIFGLVLYCVLLISYCVDPVHGMSSVCVMTH